jgi:adenylate cyclase class 2
MLEVEVRYRYPDRAALVYSLESLGARLMQDRVDVDLYFNPADRELKNSDEAFRLRRIGEKNCFTYKGPKRDKETKTRTEIEVNLAEGEETASDAVKMLHALGYRSIIEVRKHRQVYGFTRGGFSMEACFDDLERLGSFIELEIMAEEDRYEEAKAVLLQTVEALGLTEKETRSYLGMVLAANTEGG